MAVVAAKLHIPLARVPVTIRSRLHRQLDRGRQLKLTTVIAPAGFGKTVLLADWAASQSMPVAWLSLDHADNNFARFWRHAVTGLQAAVPVLQGEELLRLAMQDRDRESFVAMLLNALHRHEQDVLLVWDDFHAIDDITIIGTVAYFLEHAPRHVHVVVAGRAEPPFPLLKLQAQGELCQLGPADLRFTPDETAEFFRSCEGLRLTNAEADAIAMRTEGWITGMRLAALSLQEADDRDKLLQALNGEQRDIATYFFEEVLAQQPPDLQRFLRQTSLLDRLHGGLCDAVTGSVGSETILEELEQAHLFIVPLDDRRKWYRYHHLFQEFLQRQQRRTAPAEVDQLHHAAGEWLQTHEFSEAALEHYLAGGHHTQALQLLATLVPQLGSHEWSRLHRWLGALPDELLASEPTLFLIHLASLSLAERFDEAGQVLAWVHNVLDADPPSLPAEVAAELQAGLPFLMALRAYLERDFATCIDYSQRYLQQDPLGMALVGFGMLPDGYHRIFDISLAEGRLQEAERVLQQLLLLWRGTRNVYFVGHLLLEYAQVLYESNRLDEAEQALAEVITIACEYGNYRLHVRASRQLAMLYHSTGRWDQAVGLLRRLQDDVVAAGHPHLVRSLTAAAAWGKVRAGDKEFARQWVEQSGLRVNDALSRATLPEYELLALALAGQSRTTEAETLVRRLLAEVDRQGQYSLTIRLLVRLSLLTAQQGSHGEAYELIEEALSLAEPGRYVRTFVDEGESMAQLLSEYLRARQRQHRQPNYHVSLEFVKWLVRLIDAELGHGFDRDTDALTPRELAVLKMMADGFSNQAIADELEVRIATVKTHINNMYRKLQANSREMALERAEQKGWL